MTVVICPTHLRASLTKRTSHAVKTRLLFILLSPLHCTLTMSRKTLPTPSALRKTLHTLICSWTCSYLRYCHPKWSSYRHLVKSRTSCWCGYQGWQGCSYWASNSNWPSCRDCWRYRPVCVSWSYWYAYPCLLGSNVLGYWGRRFGCHYRCHGKQNEKGKERPAEHRPNYCSCMVLDLGRCW